MQNDAEQAVEQALLDFGDLAANGGGSLAVAAQQHFQHGNVSDGFSSSTALPS